MPSLNRVITSGVATLDADAANGANRLALRFQHTGLPGTWPDLPAGLRLDVDAAPNAVSRVVVGVDASPVTGSASTVYHVRLQRGIQNGYSKGTSVTPLPLLLSIEPLDDLLLRAGATADINLNRHFLLAGGAVSDISWSISPANTTQPVGYLSRSGTTVTVHAKAAGTVSIAIGATAVGNSTLRHTATLGVTASNTAPVESTPFPVLALTDGRPGVVVDGRNYFTDADGDSLIVTPTVADPTLAAAAVQAGTGNLIWIISPVAQGTTSIAWDADDGHGGTAQATQTVIVGANVAPVVVTPLVPLAMLVGASMPVDIGGVFADANHDVLTLYAWTDDTDVAVVRGGNPVQDAVLDADWYLTFAGLAQDATAVSIEASPITGGTGAVDWLVGAMLARGGNRAAITAASVAWSITRPQDGQIVTRLTLSVAPFPIAVAPFVQLFLRDVRVAVPTSGAFTVLARAVPSSTGLNVQASDGALTASDAAPLTVHRAPVWQSIPAQSVEAGQSVIVDLSTYAIEPDGAPLTYAVTAVPGGVTAHLDGARLFLRGVLSDVTGDVTVSAEDQYGVSVTTTIAVTVTAPPSEGPRAPLISRERAHELIRRRGDVVQLTGGETSTVYQLTGVVDSGGFALSEETRELRAGQFQIAVAAPVRLTVSDIAMQTVDASDRALLSVDNLNDETTSAADGTFHFRGERWLVAGVNLDIDSGHVLAHRFTLEPFVTVAAFAIDDTLGVPLRTDGRPAGDIQLNPGDTATWTYPPPSTRVAFSRGSYRVYDLNQQRQDSRLGGIELPAWVTFSGTQVILTPPPGTGNRFYEFNVHGIGTGANRGEYPDVRLTVRVEGIYDVRVVRGTSEQLDMRTFTSDNSIAVLGVVSGPLWATTFQWFVNFRPPADLALGYYTFSVFGRTAGGGITPTVNVIVQVAAVAPRLTANYAAETASHEAGATAATLDVAGWYTAIVVVPTYALSGAPSWITLSGSTLTIAPGASVTPDDYMATVTASAPGMSDAVVTLTVTVTAPPPRALAAVSATQAASIEAGATAQVVDVAAWYTTTNVVPTYALSGAPSWVTLSGSTLTIAPGADVTPDDYTATVTASGTGVSDAVVTLTVTVTAVVVVSQNPWSVRWIRDQSWAHPRGDDGEMSVYAGTAATDTDDDWDFPQTIKDAHSMRATISGTVYTWTTRVAAGTFSAASAMYFRWYQWRGDAVSPSRPPTSARWTLHQPLEFLDASGNVITDGPINV